LRTGYGYGLHPIEPDLSKRRRREKESTGGIREGKKKLVQSRIGVRRKESPGCVPAENIINKRVRDRNVMGHFKSEFCQGIGRNSTLGGAKGKGNIHASLGFASDSEKGSNLIVLRRPGRIARKALKRKRSHELVMVTTQIVLYRRETELRMQERHGSRAPGKKKVCSLSKKKGGRVRIRTATGRKKSLGKSMSQQLKGSQQRRLMGQEVVGAA